MSALYTIGLRYRGSGGGDESLPKENDIDQYCQLELSSYTTGCTMMDLCNEQLLADYVG